MEVVSATDERKRAVPHDIVDPIYGALKIRYRQRRLSSPPEGMKQYWDEWQVVQRQRVLSRHDTLEDAKAWLRSRIPRKYKFDKCVEIVQ